MHITRQLQIAATLALFGVISAAAASDGASPAPANSSTPEELGWKIRDTRLLKSGRLSTNHAGISLEGYAVEGKATATAGSQVPEGKFYLVLNAFCPISAAGTPAGGPWYGRGTWTLVGTEGVGRAAGTAPAGPHPGVLQGHLLTELDTNPAACQGRINATVWAPVQPPQDERVKYQGTFTGNGLFEGQLSLQAKRPAKTGMPASPAAPSATDASGSTLFDTSTNKPTTETASDPAKSKE